MSVQIICPVCGNLQVIHRGPVTDCARCHTPFPDTLRAGVERALFSEASAKPLLLVLGQFGSLFVGGLFTLLMLLAPFDVEASRLEEKRYRVRSSSGMVAGSCSPSVYCFS